MRPRVPRSFLVRYRKATKKILAGLQIFARHHFAATKSKEISIMTFSYVRKCPYFSHAAISASEYMT